MGEIEDIKDAVGKELTGLLSNWYIEQVSKKEFIIWGGISGDKLDRFYDGEYIHTSAIKNRLVKEGDIVTTRNNKYLLGKKREEK